MRLMWSFRNLSGRRTLALAGGFAWLALPVFLEAQEKPDNPTPPVVAEALKDEARVQLPGGGGALPKTEDARGNPEGEEELPEELQPDQVIPWQPSQIRLPLSWQEKERTEILNGERPPNQGGGLFPPAIWPLEPEPALEPLTSQSQAERGETAPALPGDPGREEEGSVLSPELTKAYFGKRPESVFLDPQHLLKPENAREIESLARRWLNTDFPFKTTLMIFGRDQRIPAEVDAEALMRQWSESAADSLLVFYYYHQPERTKAVFSAGSTRRFTPEQLSVAMLAAMREAGRAEGGLEQLERFCYKTTVRLHRLAKSGPLPGAHPAKAGGHRERSRAWVLSGTAVFAAALLILLTRKRRRKAGKVEAPPVLLPEQDLHPRLGAAHCGGFSAVLTFTPARRGER